MSAAQLVSSPAPSQLSSTEPTQCLHLLTHAGPPGQAEQHSRSPSHVSTTSPSSQITWP